MYIFLNLFENFAERCTKPWITSDETFRIFALQYFLNYEHQNKIGFERVLLSNPDFLPEFVIMDREWSFFRWSYLRLTSFSLPNPYKEGEYSIQVYLQSDECGRVVQFSVGN